jgi:uncharacterized membrane protein YfcA
MEYVWLCLSALAAGAVNAIAGGGTLLTFPTLLTVVDQVGANATSTTALVPGSLAGAWGFRCELAAVKRWLWLLLPPSILGGVTGTFLVILYPSYFAALVPWLVLTAAVLFSLQPLAGRFRRSAGDEPARPSALGVAGIFVFQLLVATYGGYFGAGIGILMLSGLGILGLTNLHEMNGLKNILGASINGVSVIVFACWGIIVWHYALPMAAASIVGGYVGARVSRKIHPLVVRLIITAIGYGLAIYFFVR